MMLSGPSALHDFRFPKNLTRAAKITVLHARELASS